jgi:WD40 repeat protein
VGQHEGVPYYAMQYINGHGLDDVLQDLRRLRAGQLSAEDANAKADEGSVAVARSLLTGRFGATEPKVSRDQAATPALALDESGPEGDETISEPVTPRSGVRSTTATSDGSVLSHHSDAGYYRTVARVGLQVAEALVHANQQGVLHRDTKPSNLLLDVEGHVWVTDFGLAKLEGSEGPTETGDVVGTLRYMAPERFEGWSDRRSDVYGLGMTLYELLTLHPAFKAVTRAKLIDQVIHDPPLPPRRHDARIPRDLETIVLKAINKEPGERYASAEALAADLKNFLSDRPIVARRISLPERAWRWCRRNPAAAGLLASSAVAALALVGVVVGIIYNARLEAANYRLRVARQAGESLQYFNNMVLAEREWTDSNVGRAEQLLDECVPQPGSTDLRRWEWHYLKRQCHTDLKTIPGFPGQALGVAFSPDDQHLATTGYLDKAVRVWNAQTGVLEKTLPGLTGFMSEGLAYSPDGKLLAASSGTYTEPGEVIIWDVATGNQPKKFRGVCGESSNIAFCPAGKRLAVVSGDWNKRPMLSMLDARTEQPPIEITGDEGEMGWISVAFSPDGDSIATASGTLEQGSPDTQPGEVKIRDSWTGKLMRTLLHPGPLTCVAYSPDRTRPLIATTGWDKMLRIWDVRTGQEIKSVRAGPQVSFKVVFSPDGRRLATAGDDNAARIWDATTLEEILTLRGHTREVHSLAFRSDGRLLATQSMGSTVKIWDTEPGKHPLTLPGQPGHWVQAVAFSRDGHRIASGDIDGTLRVHDTASGQNPNEFMGVTEPIEGVSFSPDGRIIATASGNWKKTETLGQITIRDAVNGAIKSTLKAHVGMALSVAFSPDGRWLVTAGGEHTKDSGAIKIWDTKTWTEFRTLEGHAKGRVRVAYSPDGRFLASAGFDNRVIIWDANTWQRLDLSISSPETYITGLAVSPDGARLATAGMDATVIVWDIATGREVCRFRGHKTIVWSVAFSPDGNRAASCGDDGSVKIWEPVTGQEALTLRGHTDPVLCVAFSPDGTRIASSSKDGTVKIWDGSPWVEPSTPTSTGATAKDSR